MSSSDKRMLDREAVRSVIQQWNANRLDLFALSEPDENLLFHGVMRFYFQDAGQKVATKCIRVASDATVSDVIETLIEKFRPDMRMLSLPNYALYEVHSNGEERKLNPDEKPLLVQLNWHIDDREGRFLLRNVDQKSNTVETTDNNFRRKLSKREKKEQKKKEKLAKLNSDNGGGGGGNSENHVAEKLYSELPETSFTRSISNPEAVMRRRRQQKLEKKLQQFRSKDGGPDTGGTLKIYGESLCRDVPYKTLLLSIRDCAQAVVREMLTKYGLEKADPLHYCLVQVNSDGTEYILDDDECPLSILMNHPTSRGSIMFHVRRRPADSQPRRRKKKPLGVSNGANNISSEREGPMLVEVTHSGDGGRRIKLGSDPIEVGSANTNSLQLFGPSIQPRHCLISLLDGVCTVTPLHADALTFVNGHHITQPTILHNGSVVMFGRVASYRFVDSPSDGRYNLALSQSQLDSACLYESRSPASPSWNDEDRALSPVNSLAQAQTTQNSKQVYFDSSDAVSQQNLRSNFDKHHHHFHPGSTGGPQPDQVSSILLNDENLNKANQNNHGNGSNDGNNYDGDNNTIETETKSISSVKSNGSNQETTTRNPKLSGSGEQQGQEPILPAVLEFPETHQEAFLRQIITDLDVNAPNFKLAPVYTMYLCARYRASTHYRPDLQPTERAHKLTVFLHHVANLIYSVVQEQYTDPRILAFWMANSSEFLHFLKSDRHISAFSVQAQEVLAESVQTAFRNLVNCFRVELSQTLNQFLSENIDHESAAGLVLTVLGSAMALLRRCRVNAALTIQLFSQLFHYINVICFNTIVTNSHMCTGEWGKVMLERLQLLELWAERQGLELAADCHLAKINQCAQFLQAPKTNVEEVQQLACSCFRLNSLQMSALLQQEQIPRNLVDTAIRMAESVADELTRADGREVRLEESPELHLALLLPDDGFSCDVVRGIPPGLVDFLNPLQGAGMCRLAAQPTSVGLWTVYMHQFNMRSPSALSSKLPQPEVQVIKLHKNSNGMGLSIVAAKGAGQERLGIYIKSVVPGGAADADGRLQAGDQLLRVDGQSLIGITQERAADYLVRTGPVVTLEVAKQGAIYHGLATLLQQPSPVIQRGNRRMSERDLNRMGPESKPPIPATSSQQLPNSKSVPALHHVGNIGMSGNKSRSIHSLVSNNEQGFYQNLSIYRAQNQSQPNLGERPQLPSQATINTIGGNTTTTSTNQPVLSRPVSAYFNSNNTSNTMPSPNSMSYLMSQSSSNHNVNVPSNGGNTPHQHLHQHLQTSQQQQQQLARLKNNTFMRDTQAQQSVRMNPMMAPSMPNIAHSSGYASNISASQSMQNVNAIPTSQSQAIYQYNNHTNSNNLHMMAGNSPQMLQSEHHNSSQPQLKQPNQMATLGRGSQMQPKHPESVGGGDLLNRRNQRYDMNLHGMDVAQQSSQQPNQLTHPNIMMNQISQKSNMGSGIQQMSQIKQLPPTAPKPQNKQQPQQMPYMHQNNSNPEENSPPLPPNTTHPLFKQNTPNTGNINYVASTLDPPKAAYYPVSASGQAGKNFVAANPWEREEREKEHEIRREHIRMWRDQQIHELSGLQHRNPQQDDQLKTLVLERDFERRALETEDQEDENESVYPKDNVQEVIRLSNQSNSISAPVTNMKQVEVKVSSSTTVVDDATNSTLTTTPPTPTTMAEPQHSYQGYPIQQSQIVPTPTVQPKSILKQSHNRYDGLTNTLPSSPSKSQKSASFADEPPRHHTLEQQNSVSQLSKEMGVMSLNSSVEQQPQPQRINETNNELPKLPREPIEPPNSSTPPPPPERNSSYIVMSQQQQKFRNSNPIMKPAVPPSLGNNAISSPITSASNNSLGYMNDVPTPPNYSTGMKRHQAGRLPNNTTTAVSNNNLVVSSPNLINSTNTTNSYMSNSISSLRDSKRVSFHDEENNCIPSQDFMTPEQADLDVIREDPNQFIQTTTALLQSPTTPETEWNTSTQQTPGVIGAQEVYRDPRQRRLQEQQQKQQLQKTGEAVPEKLSFKEKMKMFALESGENQTPKDKLKISRAQRDIDAVH